ncbi:hypothetical protein EOPP23_05980 [Endozoicomonas sp. OPT23]|nr:hypothetical protein [Endozoicomonas sp. OPT23]
MLLMILLSLASTPSASEPDFFVSLVRHCYRTPLAPLQPADWSSGPGMLTKQGREQCLEIGQHIRSSLLAKDFSKHWYKGLSQHKARGIARTRESAALILQGIYPDSSEQKIPVNSPSPDQDWLLGGPQKCGNFRTEVARLEQSAPWLELRKSFSRRLAVWKGLTGKSSEMRTVLELADVLEVRSQNRLPWPEALPVEDRELLSDRDSWILTEITSDRRVAEISALGLAEELVQAFEQYQNCRKTTLTGCERFRLLLASDINILAMLSLLGAPRDSNISLGAHLNIRLNAASQNISLWLDDKPLSIPGCTGSCPYKIWVKLIKKAVVAPAICRSANI